MKEIEIYKYCYMIYYQFPGKHKGRRNGDGGKWLRENIPFPEVAFPTKAVRQLRKHIKI